MKVTALIGAVAISFASTVSAADRTVTIEGPIQVITTPGDAGRTTYYIQDPQDVRYEIVVPPSELPKIQTVVTSSPATVLSFDGTVVDNEGGKSLNVTNWKTVTRTTSVTDELGRTRSVEQQTTTIK